MIFFDLREDPERRKWSRQNFLILKTTLETSGEDYKATLETSGEDYKTTLETSVKNSDLGFWSL